MRYLSYLLLFSLCIACLSIAGCSQPGQSGIQVQPPTRQQQYVVAVTVQMVGNNIVVTYQGGTDTDKLLHSTVTVNGIEQSKKLGNTPGDTITFEGVAPISNYRVVGYFNDGSSQTILDFDTNRPGKQPGQSGEILYPPYRTIRTPFPTITRIHTFQIPTGAIPRY